MSHLNTIDCHLDYLVDVDNPGFLLQIRHFYGLPASTDNGLSETAVAALEARLSRPLPVALRSYYRTLGAHKQLNHAHNQLLDVQHEAGLTDDGYLAFFEENQGVVLWGIRAADFALPDPPVFARYPPSLDWEPDSPSTTGFLLTMAIYNGTLGGLPYSANYLEPELLPPAVLPYIEQHYSELTGLTFQAQRFFTNEFNEVLSVSLDDQQRASALFVGTTDADQFEHLLEVLPLRWSYISEDDEMDDETDEA